ncbi:metal-sensing transcriptional repressor [Cytobacillus spongiae]|jgi:DNA-binding FrmR family transcriptional regulator
MYDEKDAMNRFKSIERQVRGIVRMMDEMKDCKSSITQ